MSRRVRGHTAKTRQRFQEENRVTIKVTASQRPKTSLGFDRDEPEFLNFLDHKPQHLQETSNDHNDTGLDRHSLTNQKVLPLSKAKVSKHEPRISIRDTTASGASSVRSSIHSAKNEAVQSSSKLNQTWQKGTSHSAGTQGKSTRSSGIARALGAVDSHARHRPSKAPSVPQKKTLLEPEKDSGKLVPKDSRSVTSTVLDQDPAKDKLLSIEPLTSVIEPDDNQRYIEGQVLSQSLEPGVPQTCEGDVMVEDADENYDTDLENDFPAPPPRKYDPSERATYIECCYSKGLIPVKYVIERLGEKSLIMKHRSLGPHGFKPLATALLNNTFIEQLDLTDNDIRGEGAICLSLTLYENLYITDLNLSDNFLRANGGISLAKVLLKNTSLRKLTLRGNHFTDSVAKAFAEALKENRSLEELDLSYNEFGEVGGLFLGAGLGLNYGLRTLNLSWNSIRNKGGVSMAASLRTNESLKRLDLSWNGLAFVGALAFARHLRKNDTLEELDISNNRIETKGAQRISAALKVNTALQCFKMGLNPIGEDGIRALITAIKKNTCLKYLGLEDITVSHKIHEEICQLEIERDIVIRTGGQTGHTQKVPLPSGMEILVQFIQDNRMRMKELFFQFDKDHSGDITRDEFKTGLKECGIKMGEKQLDALIESIDIDNSNTIEYRMLFSMNALQQSEILYGRDVVLSDRRFQRKVKIRTQQREKESIQLPKLRGFQE